MGDRPDWAGMLLQVLTDLGPTRRVVVARLRRGGYRGTRNSALSCPIAAYLLRVVPELSYVQVESMLVRARMQDGTTVVVVPPAPVGWVVAAVDNGAHPELCAEPPRKLTYVQC